ncbi:hypothetical protein [Helicobacter zhangjianzhongii]|uniref:hypothetical protein n=1 Tax=Helicobacter zhangjianzhongii TaxID=2974574 RepID=UPI002556DAEF|nr:MULTISPECIES: hypothetical protein [unclassified Helicobacter]MDL0080470.1 hypothetical protein [Helicobacter sp. CPD2-1]
MAQDKAWQSVASLVIHKRHNKKWILVKVILLAQNYGSPRIATLLTRNDDRGSIAQGLR